MSNEPEQPPYLDRRDMAVVSHMEPGETYGATKVRRAYKHYTDITNDDTAKQRQISLFESPCMEYEKMGIFRFLGTDVETEGPL